MAHVFHLECCNTGGSDTVEVEVFANDEAHAKMRAEALVKREYYNVKKITMG